MMGFITTIFVLVAGYFISKSCEFPSSKYHKTHCDIDKDFREIYYEQKCTNFVNIGKYNDEVYGIEIADEWNVKQWKINSKEAIHSKIDTRDQFITKINKLHRNGTEIWAVIQSGTEYYLFHWNLETPMKTNIWHLTKEFLSDFTFHNSTLLVFSVKAKELFVTQFKIVPGKDISVLEESKIITFENEVRKIQVSHTEIILEDINFHVVKVHFKNLLKFFNESEKTNLIHKTSMILFYIGIPLGCIGFGFLGAYLETQFKFIKQLQDKQKKANARKNYKKKTNGNAHPAKKEDQEAEPMKNDDAEEEVESEDAEENVEGENPNFDNKNNTVTNDNSRKNETDKFQENQFENDQRANRQNKTLQLKSAETQTSENEKIKISDIELCID